MQPRLETERLILRPFELSDYEFLRAFHSDPEVMKYISGNVRTEEQTRESVENGLKLAKEHPGLGTWVVVHKETNEAVANAILRMPAANLNLKGVEIGYAVLRAHWGKGYATELARALIRHTFETLNASQMVALIDAAHADSRKVLQKVGFLFWGTVDYTDPFTGTVMPTEVLELKKPR